MSLNASTPLQPGTAVRAALVAGLSLRVLRACIWRAARLLQPAAHP